MRRTARGGAAALALATAATLVGCSQTTADHASPQASASGATGSPPAATSSAAPANPGAPASDSLLDRSVARKGLRVCTTGDYLPFTHRDRTSGAYTGLDVDLVTSFAKTLGAKVTWVPTRWKTLAADYQSGRCDIAVGGISGSIERARFAYFSAPTLQDGKTPVTRCSNLARYDTIAEINQPGVRSISPEGGTNEKFARAHYPKGTLLLWQDNTTIFDQILAGRADVMTTDAVEARWAQKNHPGLCAAHPDQPFTHDQKVWLLPRGDEEFQQYVNQWFTIARNTGEFAATTKRWLA